MTFQRKNLLSLSTYSETRPRSFLSPTERDLYRIFAFICCVFTIFAFSHQISVQRHFLNTSLLDLLWSNHLIYPTGEPEFSGWYLTISVSNIQALKHHGESAQFKFCVTYSSRVEAFIRRLFQIQFWRKTVISLIVHWFPFGLTLCNKWLFLGQVDVCAFRFYFV